MWCRTTKNIGTGWLPLSCIFIRSNFKTGNTMYQKTFIFHLMLLGIPSSFVLFVKNRGAAGGGGGRVYLMDKICYAWQNLFAGDPMLRLSIQQWPFHNNIMRDKGLNLIDYYAAKCV